MVRRWSGRYRGPPLGRGILIHHWCLLMSTSNFCPYAIAVERPLLIRMWRRAFKSPATRIGLGLAIGQGAIFASTPLLTRLYGPEAFGLMTVGLAIASIFATFGTFRLELVIPRLDDEDVSRAARLSVLTLSTAAVVCTAATHILIAPGVLESILVGIVAWLIGGAAVRQQRLIRFNDLRHIGSAKAAQGLGQVVTQGGLAHISPSAAGLLGGLTAGYAISFSVLRSSQPRTKGPLRVWDFARTHMPRLVRLTIAATLNAVTVAFLPLLLTLYFGSATTGEYSVVHRIAIVPVGLAIAALSPVIIAAASSAIRAAKPTWRVIVAWLRRLTLAGLLAGSGIVLVPEPLLTSLLGANFQGAHRYLAPLALIVASQLVCGPLSTLLAVLERDRSQLLWDLMRFLAVAVSGVLTAALSRDPVVTVWMVSVIISVFYAGYIFMLKHASQRLDSSI